MVSYALLFRFEVKPEMDTEAEQFLQSVRTMVQSEKDTTAWFAIRFGRSEYGIFAAFPDQVARDAHLEGMTGNAIRKAGVLFTGAPQTERIAVLDDKLPSLGSEVTKGLLLTFKAKAGHEGDVEEFLISAAPLARDEPKTTAWFALRRENGEYGIFDVFPDNGGRFAHLTGRIPRDLARHAFSLLGGMPDLEMLNIVADKLPG